MTEIDLTKTTEAAARVIYELTGSRWSEALPSVQHNVREAALDVILVAWKDIARQSWEQGYDEAAHWKYPEDHKHNPYEVQA